MPKSIPLFTGIPKEGIEFLEELPKRDKDWFNDWRDLYEESLLLPTKALVVAVGERLQKSVSESLTAKPAINGSISPIFRDLRFSSDKTVFKDNLMLNFWDGSPKKTAPTLRIRITPHQIGFSVGAVFAEQPLLDHWRNAIADPSSGKIIEQAIDDLKHQFPINIPEPELKKTPSSFENDHPRKELLRRKSIQLRWPESTPPSIHESSFADWCSERLEQTKAIHLWFKNNL